MSWWYAPVSVVHEFFSPTAFFFFFTAQSILTLSVHAPECYSSYLVCRSVNIGSLRSFVVSLTYQIEVQYGIVVLFLVEELGRPGFLDRLNKEHSATFRSMQVILLYLVWSLMS